MNTSHILPQMNPPHHFNINNSPWVKDDINKWAAILQGEKPIRYKKRTRFFSSDDKLNHLYIMQTGLAVVSLFSTEGTEKHLFFQGTGSIIGEVEMISQRRALVSAEAITECSIYKIPAEKIRVASSNPEFEKNLKESLSQKVSVLLSQIYNLSFLQCSARVAIILLHLVEQYGTETSQGFQISLRITHEQLARLVNTSRVTISQILKKMERNEIIAKSSGKLLITDLYKLNAMAVR